MGCSSVLSLVFTVVCPGGSSRDESSFHGVVKGGISGDLAQIFRGEGNIKMMAGWDG